jgi:hypothetical protein
MIDVNALLVDVVTLVDVVAFGVSPGLFKVETPKKSSNVQPFTISSLVPICVRWRPVDTKQSASQVSQHLRGRTACGFSIPIKTLSPLQPSRFL